MAKKPVQDHPLSAITWGKVPVQDCAPYYNSGSAKLRNDYIDHLTRVLSAGCGKKMNPEICKRPLPKEDFYEFTPDEEEEMEISPIPLDEYFEMSHWFMY